MYGTNLIDCANIPAANNKSAAADTTKNANLFILLPLQKPRVPIPLENGGFKPV